MLTSQDIVAAIIFSFVVFGACMGLIWGFLYIFGKILAFIDKQLYEHYY
jgi:hypothetical protein